MNVPLLITTTLLLASCTSLPSPTPPPQPDAADASQVILDAAPAPAEAGQEGGARDECIEVYLRLVGVGCEPIAGRTGSWVDVCHNDRPHGLFDLTCMKTIRDLAGALKCGVGCRVQK